MGKLHEVLAVEPDLRENANRVRGEVIQLFKEAPDRIAGFKRAYSPLNEDGEELEPEEKQVATTVQAEIEKAAEAIGKYIDATISKEMANTEAAANVILKLDGEEYTFLADMPATALLNLESRLNEIRAIYTSIPTLDPTIGFEFDEGSGYFVNKRVKYRTQKEPFTHIEYEATEEHPAQVQTFQRDVRIGNWEETFFSGAITLVDKHAKLQRIDQLIQAVKKARQRANEVEASSIDIAGKIFNFINVGHLD
jgi:hypothetical protein